MTHEPRAIVIAWDDVVAETLTMRASALHGALDAERVRVEFVDVIGTVGGRTFSEAARLLLHESSTDADELLVDLVALRATRANADALAAGVSVAPDAVVYVRAAAARGSRVVLRADSARSETLAVLSPLGIADLFAFIRCSDDTGPRSHEPAPAPVRIVDRRLATTSSVARSYAVIDARLRAVGIPPEDRLAIERHPIAADAASSLVFTSSIGL